MPDHDERQQLDPEEAPSTNASTGRSAETEASALLPEISVQSLFGPDLSPRAELLELLEHLKIEHDGTLVGINEATQQVMQDIQSVLRAETAEQIQRPVAVHATDIESLATGPLNDRTRELLHNLGLWDRLDAPVDSTHDAAVGFGGRAGRVSERLLHLAGQWQDRGVRFNALVLTGSSRSMNPDYGETREGLLRLTNPDFDDQHDDLSQLLREGRGASELPDPVTELTEAQVMVWLVRHHPGLPETWRDGTVALYQKVAPNRGADAERASASTDETVRAAFVRVNEDENVSDEQINGWAELGNSFLADSSQPYVLRQSLTLAHTFMEEGSPELSITGIGDAPFEDKEASFVIELAKLIHTERKLRGL